MSIKKLEVKVNFLLLTGAVEQQPCWVIILEVCCVFYLFQFHLSDRMLPLELRGKSCEYLMFVNVIHVMTYFIYFFHHIFHFMTY